MKYLKKKYWIFLDDIIIIFYMFVNMDLLFWNGYEDKIYRCVVIWIIIFIENENVYIDKNE